MVNWQPNTYGPPGTNTGGGMPTRLATHWRTQGATLEQKTADFLNELAGLKNGALSLLHKFEKLKPNADGNYVLSKDSDEIKELQKYIDKYNSMNPNGPPLKLEDFCTKQGDNYVFTKEQMTKTTTWLTDVVTATDELSKNLTTKLQEYKDKLGSWEKAFAALIADLFKCMQASVEGTPV